MNDFTHFTVNLGKKRKTIKLDSLLCELLILRFNQQPNTNLGYHLLHQWIKYVAQNVAYFSKSSSIANYVTCEMIAVVAGQPLSQSYAVYKHLFDSKLGD